MTDIEATLPDILRAEADRYELPVFSAQRIAENAVRKGFWRQRKVLTLAAIGLAGAAGGGGALLAAAGHDTHDRVTVTFRASHWEAAGVPTDPAEADTVRAWVQGRIRAEGLKDVDVTVRLDPDTLVITGRASDGERLRMLGESSSLFLVRMYSDSEDYGQRVKNPPPRCLEKQDIGPPVQLCYPNGFMITSFSGDSGNGLHPVAAHAVRRGPGTLGWAVVIQLDAATTDRYRALTQDQAQTHERISLQAGSVVIAQPVITEPVRDGVIESDTGFTEQQAKDLAVNVLTPGPSGFFADSVTMSPAPRG